MRNSEIYLEKKLPADRALYHGRRVLVAGGVSPAGNTPSGKTHTVRRCPVCHAELPHGARVCPVCGRAL